MMNTDRMKPWLSENRVRQLLISKYQPVSIFLPFDIERPCRTLVFFVFLSFFYLGFCFTYFPFNSLGQAVGTAIFLFYFNFVPMG
jgi:hypothetical protein